MPNTILTAFQIDIVIKRKAVSPSARITRLTAEGGLSENPKSDATCLYSVYFNRLKIVCQPFSAENDLFLIIFFQKFFGLRVGGAEAIDIVRAAQKNFPHGRGFADQRALVEYAIILVVEPAVL